MRIIYGKFFKKFPKSAYCIMCKMKNTKKKHYREDSFLVKYHHHMYDSVVGKVCWENRQFKNNHTMVSEVKYYLYKLLTKQCWKNTKKWKKNNIIKTQQQPNTTKYITYNAIELFSVYLFFVYKTPWTIFIFVFK